MPMVPVTLPSVWTVPVAAGVPLLLGQSVTHGVQAAASVSIGTVLDDLLISQAAGQWGIFNSAGQSVLSAARVLSVAGESEHHIATAPLEDGSFLSYSKVATPRTHRVLMVCDGSETGLASQALSALLPQAASSLAGAEGLYVRKAFFATLSALEADLSLYSVITPERKYENVNITGHRWLRDARHGITMPVVEITLQEVRVSATQSFTTTQQPQGQRMLCGGVVPSQSSPTLTSSNSLYESAETQGTSQNITGWANLAGSPL